VVNHLSLQKISISLSFCLIAIFAYTKQAKSEFLQKWESDSVYIKNLINNGDCDKAWKIAWPYVEARNGMAMSLLATAMTDFNLIGPGRKKPSKYKLISQEREYATLILYGWLYYNKSDAMDHRAKLGIGGIGFRDARFERIARCMNSWSSRESCLQLARELKAVPYLEDYFEEVRESKLSVRCLKSQ
jgi:hypothetical protein